MSSIKTPICCLSLLGGQNKRHRKRRQAIFTLASRGLASAAGWTRYPNDCARALRSTLFFRLVDARLAPVPRKRCRTDIASISVRVIATYQCDSFSTAVVVLHFFDPPTTGRHKKGLPSAKRRHLHTRTSEGQRRTVLQTRRGAPTTIATDNAEVFVVAQQSLHGTQEPEQQSQAKIWHHEPPGCQPREITLGEKGIASRERELG